MEGGILLQQVRISKRLYLHHFVKPEPADMFHIHRWVKMCSWVLFGSYVEERLYADRTSSKVKHRFLTTFKMDRSVIHRIDSWSPKCWTLFFFEGDEGWGYVDRDFNYTPWDEYIPEEKRVKHV